MPTPAEDRARALAFAQDFGAEALDLNQRLVAANPADAGSHTRLARCYLEAGRLDEAEAEYREALRLNPANRIAAGGLETIQRKRHEAEFPGATARPARRVRVARDPVRRERGSAGASEVFGDEAADVPQTFTGFDGQAFADLARCPRRLVQERFAPRVIDLVRRVNALPASVEMAGIREPGKRQLFRTARTDVHPADAHWYVFNLGGRWEPQCNIGMYAGKGVGNWLRIGIGFNVSETGADPDRAAGAQRAREWFRYFQQILATSPRRSLFLGWMVKENGLLQYGDGGPRLDLHEPSQVAGLITGFDPDRIGWVFFGKWLRVEEPEAACVLADPVMLVRTVDRVFTGLVPLWRTLHEHA